MNANAKFFKTMFLVNAVLGAIGFLILWAVRAITSNSVIGLIITAVVILGFAAYLNFFVVKKSKLKTLYFLYGTVINAIVAFVPTVLMMVL